MNIKLDSIRIDGNTQVRTEVNIDTVNDYAERMLADEAFPPVILFHDGRDYWLADGFHRYHASRKIERVSIAAEVHKGTSDDALWFALTANKTNGMRMTTADKARACKLALAKWPEKSDRALADHIGCDHSTVAKYRQELKQSNTRNISTGGEFRHLTDGQENSSDEQGEESGGEIPQLKREGKDGKQYPVQQPEPAKPVEPPAPEIPVVDQVGKPIPDIRNLRERFARREEISAFQREISALKGRVVEAAANSSDKLWDRLDVSAFEADMKHAFQLLKAIKPYAVCPLCGGGDAGAGENCRQCDGKGWIDEFSYQFVPKELK